MVRDFAARIIWTYGSLDLFWTEIGGSCSQNNKSVLPFGRLDSVIFFIRAPRWRYRWSRWKKAGTNESS